MPESANLEAQTLDKLSTAPWRLLGKAPANHETALTNAGPALKHFLLRPLLADLVSEESYWESSSTTNRPPEIVLAIKLPDQRANLWRTNLAVVMESLLEA